MARKVKYATVPKLSIKLADLAPRGVSRQLMRTRIKQQQRNVYIPQSKISLEFIFGPFTN